MKKAIKLDNDLSQNSSVSHKEFCANPWNGDCESTDIALYIYYKGKNLPICRSCWSEIANRDIEWWGGDIA